MQKVHEIYDDEGGAFLCVKEKARRGNVIAGHVVVM